ncbi:MAG: nickel-dependent lactate racemase [Deltaproteobacteria bacterium]|nr:nickel-dependent lactate racemase [Deltaproteobacteria bacterium]
MEDSKIRVHYGEKILEFKLPPGWSLLGNLQTQNLPPIGRNEMVRCLQNPLGTLRLQEIARGKKNAVVIASDVTRPVQGEIALPLILNSLNRGGIADENILLIMGGGTHQAPQDLPEAYKEKYGQEVVDRLKILYHNPDEDLIYLGQTRRGHPIEVNRWVAEADLKVAFGGIIPHGLGGYSGGAKSILPAVSSRESIIQNHLMVVEPGVGIGLVEGNPMREEMEEIAERVGLDFIFNLVLNAEGDPVGAVSGDFRQAHRQGVALARQIFQAELPSRAQVVFTSGHPFDIHFYQSLKGPYSVLNACQDGGTIIHLTPAYEGVRAGTKRLFSTVRTIGYEPLFERLKSGERKDESVRSFFYPEVNIGGGMTIFRAMVKRRIQIMVVTEGIAPSELEDMGFEHAPTLEKAISLIHQRIPRAEVAAALNSKVIVSFAGGQSCP